ncbi:uncharacterized protein LOC122293494 [Carya illinoinensis]|uniref:uncharacterized protein LOC122293494 n=1 Tax=Carya illinoinensis TaxID=32201 RepID=UPI001C726477|nr:uncharacterized protein LOC122293494 [Carya illinoinensis]
MAMLGGHAGASGSGGGIPEPSRELAAATGGAGEDGDRAETSHAGGGRSFAQALQRPIPTAKFRIPLRKPELISGELGFVFSEVEISRVAKELKYALVLKFFSKRPSIDVLRRQIIKSWGFSEVPIISFMDELHVLLHLANEKDYLHAWAREGRYVAGCSFRLFNWTADFNVKKEPSIAPQWIYLPGLPLHLYRMDILQIFASRFGRFLGTDNATLYRTRATGARMCVEVDLLEEPVAGFPLVTGKTQIWQRVVYEKKGFYCKKCFRQGHTEMVCRTGETVNRMSRREGKKVLEKEGEERVWKEVGQK